MAIVFYPAGSIGRVMGSAPRAWLTGVVSSRAELSSALIIRLLGTSGLFSVAALATLPIASMLNLEGKKLTGAQGISPSIAIYRHFERLDLLAFGLSILLSTDVPLSKIHPIRQLRISG